MKNNYFFMQVTCKIYYWLFCFVMFYYAINKKSLCFWLLARKVGIHWKDKLAEDSR